MNIIAFADASKTEEKGQLGMVAGLMLCKIKTGSLFHAIQWSPKRAKRPANFVASAEVLSTGDASDEGLILKSAYNKLLGTNVGLMIVAASKDLYDTVLTKRLTTDKTIKGVVATLRYEFEVGSIKKMVWIPGKFNLADPIKKHDSPPEKSLQLTLSSGKMSTDLSSCKENTSKKPTG